MKHPNVNKSVTSVDAARELTADELQAANGGLIPGLLLLAGAYKAGEILGGLIADVQSSK